MDTVALSPTQIERFKSRIATGSGCHLWTGGKTTAGYGAMRVGNKTVYAHRIAYEMSGRTDNPRTIDHICRNKSCVNPDHLRPATPKQNAENLGLAPNNKSGFRGVHYSKHKRGWVAEAVHRGHKYYAGTFPTPAEAGEAARKLRLQLFTYNDDDRTESA